MPSPLLDVENVMRTQTVRDYLQSTYGYVHPKPATKKRMSESEFWNRLLRELETDPDEELRRRHRADRGRKRMQDLAEKLHRGSIKRSTYGGSYPDVVTSMPDVPTNHLTLLPVLQSVFKVWPPL